MLKVVTHGGVTPQLQMRQIRLTILKIRSFESNGLSSMDVVATPTFIVPSLFSMPVRIACLVCAMDILQALSSRMMQISNTIELLFSATTLMEQIESPTTWHLRTTLNMVNMRRTIIINCAKQPLATMDCITLIVPSMDEMPGTPDRIRMPTDTVMNVLKRGSIILTGVRPLGLTLPYL
jgi:hypothetical protein